MNVERTLHTDPDDIVIARYLSNEATPEQCAIVERWIEYDPARKERMQRIESMWDQPRLNVDRWDAGRLFANLKKRKDAECK